MGILDYFTPEARRGNRQALEGLLMQFIPPEMRPQLNLLAELNPVVSMERAGQDAQQLFAPDQTLMDRLAAGGRMASNMAGVVAPAMVAGRAGVPVANAVQDVLTGYSPMVQPFMADEFGGAALNRFPFYHGTPDARAVREAGGFEPSKPVFLSDNPSVARTYADPRRAWDYQGAEPDVFTAMTSPQRIIDINAGGSDFRGISADAVTRGLLDAGIPSDDVATLIANAAARRSDNRISTNDLADMLQGLGFDAADIANVRDTYNATAKAPKSTVRMMFDPAQIDISEYLSKKRQM